MKKYFFFALAAAGLLSSCSSDDTVAGTEVENDELVPIQIGFGGGSVSVDETRGTGTVGGYQGTDENKWHGQHFNVYMLEKNSMRIARFEGLDIFKNTEFVAPGPYQSTQLPDASGVTPFANLDNSQVGAAESGIARPIDAKIKYYPAQNNFDFYAYRLDDAATASPVIDADSTYWSVPFKIDGSQDIMVAKAIPTTDEINSLKLINNNASNGNRYYSSFSARHGVQPNLKFKHLLSRFTFKLIPKGECTNSTSGIIVDSIKVFSNKTQGSLVIAAVGDNNGNSQKIIWDESSSKDSLALMQRDYAHHAETNIDSLDLVQLDSIDFRGRNVGDTISVGESLLVAPGESQYELRIYGHQYLPLDYTNGTPAKKKYSFVYTDQIRRSSGVFAAGASYDVKISLWGVKNIELNTVLTGYIDASAINVNIEPEETKINGFAD